MEVSTELVLTRIHVQEWTHVYNPTCLVETSTGHKPHPKNNHNASELGFTKTQINTEVKIED